MLEKNNENLQTIDLNELESINGGGFDPVTYAKITAATWAACYGAGHAIGEFAYYITH